MNRQYQKFSCRDTAEDCDFMVRAETDQEVLAHGSTHLCSMHGKCHTLLEIAKIRAHIKPAFKGRREEPYDPFVN